MNLILILAAVMTFTVETKNSVSASGDVPPTMQASYANTYNKGHVRGGDTATLSLSGLGGITVEKIELTMRSTKNSGAGAIVAMANGTQIAAKTVSYTEVADPVVAWTGVMTNVQDLEIIIGGHQNSLYIDAFTITWSPAPAHAVTLMKGDVAIDTLREASGMEGVVLPTMEDEKEWSFIGWTGTPFWQISEKPTVYNANSTFYPSSDCTLWAVYNFEDPAESAYQTELVSGTYVYMNETAGIALAGVPVDGRMSNASVNAADSNQYYRIDFVTESTATITHEATQTLIGYDTYSPKMSAKASVWNVYHEGEQTLFWTTISNKNYVLWLNIYDLTSQTFYAGLLQADPTTSPMRLLPAVQSAGGTVYTCHPENGVGIEQVSDEGISGLADEWKVVFGIYELYIRNGKKYMKIR